MRSKLLIFSCLIWFASCASHRQETSLSQSQPQTTVQTLQLDLVDQTRNRSVPVLLYSSATGKTTKTSGKLAVLNHGYGGTKAAYSFLANYLVTQGYVVASIQHEIPGDAPIPTTGNLYEARLPHWQRGVQNIRFVVQELNKRYPELEVNQLLLIGHSNGGDMVMLFAQHYPEQVQKIISLDNRRVPLPRTQHPQILTLRSSDQVADAGVLPSVEEQEKLGIRVIQLESTLHNDMWDGATTAQKQEMLRYISQFLQQN